MGHHLVHRGIPIYEIEADGVTRYQYHLPNYGGVISDTLKEVQERIDAHTIILNDEEIDRLEEKIAYLREYNEKIRTEKWP